MTNYSRYARVWSGLCRVLLCAAIGLSALSATSCRSTSTAVQTTLHSDSLSRGSSESVTLETVTQAVAGDSVKLEIPIESLRILPEGASYSRKDGRTRVTLSRHGDTLVADAETDSVPQALHRYEHRARDTLYQRGESTQQSSQQKETSDRNWIIWVCIGIVTLALMKVIRTIFK